MKKTILLVEDSNVQKLASERVLFKAGYLVLLAGDGEEALRLARESVPDLVLLDLLLPGIGGEGVLHTQARSAHRASNMRGSTRGVLFRSILHSIRSALRIAVLRSNK